VDYPDDSDPSDMPGQVRYEFRGATTVVQLDVAEARGSDERGITVWADGVPDAEIVLLGRHHLTAEDFVL
jgi:hypothetical protein